MFLDRPVSEQDAAEVLDLLRRGGAAAGQGGMESAGGVADPQERLDRLDQRLRHRAEHAPTVRDLADQVMIGARNALPKADDAKAAMTVRELAGLEAVILTDGTRPSLTVNDGFVDLKRADTGRWRPALAHFEAAIRAVTGAVGRIDSAGAAIGTGFMVGPDLVLTNRHVLEEIARWSDSGWSLNAPDATTIDFSGEKNDASPRLGRVREVAFAPSLAIERCLRLDRLDLALLRVEVDGDAPPPLALEPDPDLLFKERDLYVVGFPAKPYSYFGSGPPPAQHEANIVLKAVFGFDFGVKKLAPGRAGKLPGEIAGDIHNWAFSHDASTLGGNSGSCVADLAEDAGRIVGLHFAGISRARNYAHSLAALRDQLEPLGVAYAQDR